MQNFDLSKREFSPSKINQYSILKTLQKSYNGSRSTYLAETCKGEKVVLKEFKFVEKSSQWGEFRQIEKELAALSELDHSNIPKVIETFESDHELYLVIEYISGKSLDEKDLSLEEVISLCKSMLNILEYIQQKNTVHRDIKPQNIILGDDQKYYLIDFGLATQVQYSITSSSIIAGTLGFMPPELLRQQKLGNSADLYSLAVTIYCLITKTTNSDLGKLIDSRNVLSVSALDTKVSSKFKLWLSTCLEPDPRDRFSNAAEAKSAFDQISSFKPDINIPKSFKTKRKKSKIFNLKTVGLSILGLAIFAIIAYLAVILGKHAIAFTSTIDWSNLMPKSGNSPEAKMLKLSSIIIGLLRFFVWFPIAVIGIILPFTMSSGNIMRLDLFILPVVASITMSIGLNIVEETIGGWIFSFFPF